MYNTLAWLSAGSSAHGSLLWCDVTCVTSISCWIYPTHINYALCTLLPNVPYSTKTLELNTIICWIKGFISLLSMCTKKEHYCCPVIVFWKVFRLFSTITANWFSLLTFFTHQPSGKTSLRYYYPNMETRAPWLGQYLIFLLSLINHLYLLSSGLWLTVQM